MEATPENKTRFVSLFSFFSSPHIVQRRDTKKGFAHSSKSTTVSFSKKGTMRSL